MKKLNFDYMMFQLTSEGAPSITIQSPMNAARRKRLKVMRIFQILPALAAITLVVFSEIPVAFTHPSPVPSPAPEASSNNKVPKELQDIGIVERLGEQVTVGDLKFRNEAGVEVLLSSYFKKTRPVLLALVYYECPTLCNFILNGLVNTLKDFAWTPGEQFDIVTVSIDAAEDSTLATQKKAVYLKEYGRLEAAKGWHFLTGAEDQIQKLANQVGFKFRYDEEQDQYAHGAALFVLTPEGKISRYLYGIEFRERDLRLALLEASSGKIGSVIDRILLYCYRYDPVTRKYSVYMTKVMQAGGAGTVLIFGGYLAVFWRQQRRKQTRS